MRTTVFLAHGDGLTFGLGLLLAPAELDPPDVGVLVDVEGPPEGAFVPVAVGFGDELSLADGDGESDPPWLDDVLGVGLGGLMAPIPEEEGCAEGLALAQLGEVEEPPNGKIPPTGALLCVFTLPDPPLAPPPEPVFPPDELAELALPRIACWASRATYAPAATMETVTPSAASGRSQLSVRAARPPPLAEVGPNRSHATRVAFVTHSDADWNPPGARRIMSVQTASAQASASGRGRPRRL